MKIKEDDTDFRKIMSVYDINTIPKRYILEVFKNIKRT
jgi:hypothetical protein